MKKELSQKETKKEFNCRDKRKKAVGWGERWEGVQDRGDIYMPMVDSC